MDIIVRRRSRPLAIQFIETVLHSFGKKVQVEILEDECNHTYCDR